MEQLASKYPTVLMMEVERDEVDFDVVALPTLLVYKRNQIILNAVRLDLDMDDRFSLSAVEDFLIRFTRSMLTFFS